MRIGIFTDTYLPDINGVVSSVELLRKKLEELGNDVFVICAHKGVKIKYEGNIIHLPGIEIKKLYGYTLSSPIHYLFIEEIKKLDLDIIHAETEFGVGLFANIVSANLDIPLVRTYHTTYEDYSHYLNILHSKTLDKGIKKGIIYLSKVYCNHCVKLISPSFKTAKMLKDYGVNSDINIIPTGIELERFEEKNVDMSLALKIRKDLKIKDDEKLLLFVGRIAKEKAIDKIINAFKKVKENNLKIKLLIVGDGPSLDELKKLNKELGLEDYIYFAGKKPFNEVPIYYHGADGFISASTSETQGMTYIEALASGLIVLANYDEVLTDLIIENKNGYFFNNEEEIYEVIKRFSQLDNDTYLKMSKYALNSIKKYDANKFGEDSLALYKEAIEDYKYSYIIRKTKLKDDYVILELEAYSGESEKLTLSLDDYYNGGFRNDTKVTRLIYESLRKKEKYGLAYKACIKKLSIKDYSLKQIKDFLNEKYELNEEEINKIIDRLNEYGLLDDNRLAIEKINAFNSNFLSNKAIKNRLQKIGIDEETIKKNIINDLDDELSKAKNKAKSYLRNVQNKSLNHKKQAIYNKLINDGFSSDTAKEALSYLDFTEAILNEKDLLKKEALKAKKKYENKYEGSELRNHIYLKLISKGFSYDSVYAIINEMEL